MKGIRRGRQRGMVIRKNTGQHKGGIELAANCQNDHLLANRGSSPDTRATGAAGQPVKPGSLHAAGLDTTEPLIAIDFSHNTGADKVSDRAGDVLNGI